MTLLQHERLRRHGLLSSHDGGVKAMPPGALVRCAALRCGYGAAAVQAVRPSVSQCCCTQGTELGGPVCVGDGAGKNPQTGSTGCSGAPLWVMGV